MHAIIAMGLSLILLVALLHRKVKVGIAMVIASIALAAMLRVTPMAMWRHFFIEWQSKPLTHTSGYLFVSIAALLSFVNALGSAMRTTGISDRLVPAMLSIFRSRRFALVSVPLVMGLLPTPGGIMLSAPMVRDLGDSLGLERSRLAAINFYFRHQWEGLWPLFPAVPLMEGILGVPVRSIIAHNMIIWVAGMLAGSVFLLFTGMVSMKPAEIKKSPLHHNIKGLFGAFWPIIIAAGLYAGFDLPPAVGVFLALIAFLLLHRVGFRTSFTIFKDAVRGDMILLIFGSIFFKFNLEAADAVGAAMEVFSDNQIPELAIVFLLPFIVAFLIGVTAASVAVTFPFLVPIIGSSDGAHLSLMTLAFAGILAGLNFSPIHLCLPMSAEYFQVPLTSIIRKLVLPILVMVIAAIAAAVLI